MANNRMVLVHEASGQRVLLAKHFGDRWKIWDDELANRLTDAFKAEAANGGWPSTGWHLEFEHHSKDDDPLMPNTTETWQDADGKWHLGNRPR